MPPRRGAKSNNPNGRPLLGKGKRPTLTCTVDPATLEYLRAFAEAYGLSLGAVVDQAAETLKRTWPADVLAQVAAKNSPN